MSCLLLIVLGSGWSFGFLSLAAPTPYIKLCGRDFLQSCLSTVWKGEVFSIKMMFKRFGALLAALMLSTTLCCTTAFAAPAIAPSGLESDALVDVVPDSEAAGEDVGEAEQDSNPFGRSYVIKGVAVVGVGVVFYVVLAAKSKRKK